MQGTHRTGKTGKTWKMVNKYSVQGKLREFENFAKTQGKLREFQSDIFFNLLIIISPEL